MATENRMIRVFISSTFRDLQQERQELVKFIFPKLRKICEERGVTWGEVDLRWGVSDEQKAEGKVLPICLEEIRHCRPYFIGILGERYGWIPESIPEELIKQQPWLKEHLQKSVTDLEIHYGVFHEPEMSNRAFFYFRDPGYIDSLPPEQKQDCIEHAYTYEIAKYGLQEAEHRANLRKQRLDELKQRIRDTYPDRMRVFRDSRELGELVWQDMKAVIDQLYPVDTKPDPLQRDAFEHEQFAQSRSRVYIGRKEYFQKLDDHAKGDGLPLVIVGDSGSGKSALLANWSLHYREKHPDELVLMHFIGATTYSADWALMVWRIMAELQRAFKIEGEIPDKADALRQAFANWLNMAAARGRVILILDALNQLEDRDGAPDLVWLPPLIPPNVRLVLSTLPGRPLDDLNKRAWPKLRIEPFTDAEREKFILQYLTQYTKTLGAKQSARIIAAKQTANPLYLQALLEELRLFGEHERLDERIDDYLRALTIPDLYAKILARYEEDYQRDRPNLIEESFSLLWAARRGLSEGELLELLGTGGEPLPAAVWVPLYLAARHSLMNRAGLLGFSHDYFRQAVRQRYLPTNAQQKTTHGRLAEYFSSKETGIRKISELPWQLAESEDWYFLVSLLQSENFFLELWKISRFELAAYWKMIETKTNFRAPEAYQNVTQTPESYLSENYVNKVKLLLECLGYQSNAYILDCYLAEHYLSLGRDEELASCLVGQAIFLLDTGPLSEALRLLYKAEKIYETYTNKYGLSVVYGNISCILSLQGKLSKAFEYAQKQAHISKLLGNSYGLSRALISQASIKTSENNLNEAKYLFEQAEKIARETGDKEALAFCLYKQSSIFLNSQNSVDQAEELLDQARQTFNEIGQREGVAKTLLCSSLLSLTKGEVKKACENIEQAIQLSRDSVNVRLQAHILYTQSIILEILGNNIGAEELKQKSIQKLKELGAVNVLETINKSGVKQN